MRSSKVQPVANRNAVLDPPYARAEVDRIYRPQVDVARDVCDYGANLMMRVFKSGVSTFRDGIIVTVLFRQILATLDAVVVLLEQGAVYAAEIPLRSLLEATWTLEWMLSEGDEEAVRRYYVAFVRAQRSWMKSMVPGSREHRALRPIFEAAGKHKILQKTPEQVAVLRGQLRDIDNHLRRKVYRDVNRKLAMQERKPGRDVEWYKPGRPGSLRVMVRDIGREEEYAGLYRSFSYTVHGSAMRKHIDVSGSVITLEPVRGVENFGGIFRNALGLAWRAYRLVTREYRSGEMDVLKRTYTARWDAAFTRVPVVRVEGQQS